VSAIDREFKVPEDESEWGATHYNVCEQSDKCGFIHIFECSQPDMSYEFNTYLVLKDIETSKFYGTGDSGCSCPTPFEDITRMSQLTRIESKERLMDELESWFHDELTSDYDEGLRGPMRDAINDAIAVARKAGLE